MFKKAKKEGLSFEPVIKYIIVYCVLVIIAQIVTASAYAFETMKKEADFIVDTTKSQIDYRIQNTVSLLTSLSQSKSLLDDNISYADKAAELNKYSQSYEYLMIRMIDKDFNVYNERGYSANLASRDYMQKLLATGKTQVTDAFAAGVDGKTLNYTVVVPIFKDGKFDGGIFASIYFDEIEKRLTSNIKNNYQQVILFGSQTQVMSITDDDIYGTKYKDIMNNKILLQSDIHTVEESMYNKKSTSYWFFGSGNILYETVMPIENTPWTISCRLNFFGTLSQFITVISAMIFMSVIACVFLILIAKKYIQSQMSTVNMLLSSVQDLEKRIYQNEKPDNVDFKEIINLTSKGLTDGLTGVITRTVFLNQIPFKLKAIKLGEFAALCFVDVDNLKAINDTYGHGVGDMTLKNVGYTLREYEKKYDGVVGRYGGDEFVLFLSGFESLDSLEKCITDLTNQLISEVFVDDVRVSTRCSVGVTICHEYEEIDQLIKEADEMLYAVKQSGKGSYRIYKI